MATVKFLRQLNGRVSQVNTIETSAGAADAAKVPNTNADGYLDRTIIGGVTASAGPGDVNKPACVGSDGKLDVSFMPTGVAAEALSITATETIAAGSFVNIYNSTGLKVRLADATNDRQAHGYAPAGIANGAAGTIWFEGANSGLSSRTVGATQFLGAAGAATETAPEVGVGGVVAGHISQILGTATSATSALFEPEPPITLA